MAASYILTIGGVVKTIEVGWSLSETVNGRSRFSFDVLSPNGTYRPAIGLEVIFTENGVRIFGGFIDTPAERGFGAGYAIVTHVTASDYNGLASRKFVQGFTIAAGTTLSGAVSLLVSQLSAYGVTVDPAQSTGPPLPLLEYDVQSVAQVLDALSVITGYVWDVDYNKRLRMHTVGEVTAPFNITTASKYIINDVTVDTSRDNYANRILVKAGTGTKEVTETLTSAGGVVFPLTYQLYSNRGYISVGAANETIGDAAPHWVYNSAANTMTRASATAAAVSITYIAQFPYVAIADAGAAAADVVERVIDEPDVFAADVAQALATGYLARAESVTQTLTYPTLKLGLHAGQTQTITIPERNASGTFLITDVQTSNPSGSYVVRTVTVTGGAQYHGSWRDDLRAGNSSGSSLGGGTIVMTGGGAGASVGSGTIGTIPTWLTGTTLGDSVLTGNGSRVQGAFRIGAGSTALAQGGNGLLIASDDPMLDLYDSDQGADLKRWRMLGSGGALFFQSLDDAYTAATTQLSLDRVGSAAIAGQLSVKAGISTPPLTNLTLSPTGDLILDPSGNDVLPLVNYDINLGSPTKKFLGLHASELVVDNLVAADVRSTVGGRFKVGPSTELMVDITTTDTTIATKHNNVAVGDVIEFQSRGNLEYMAVTSAGGTIQVPWTLGGTLSLLFAPTVMVTAFAYTVTRNLDGTGANTWQAGDGIFNTRTTGYGWLDFDAAGPRMTGHVRAGSVYSAVETQWAIGNLNSYYGYSTDVFGAAFGVASGAWVKIDPTNGVRIGHNTTTKISLDASGNATFAGALSAATGTFAGALSAATGTFSGTLSAVGGSFAAGQTLIDSNGVSIGSGYATATNKRLMVMGQNALNSSYSLLCYNSNGAVGLYCANDLEVFNQKLYLADTFYAAALGSNTGTTLVRDASGFIRLNTSSETGKTNIRRAWTPTDPRAFLGISPIQFDYPGGASDVLGFSAEDMAASGLAGLVNYTESGAPESIRDHAVMAYTLVAVKALDARVALLEARPR